MAENVLFGHPNEIDSATVFGGSWTGDQPITEVQDRIINRRARSSSLSTSDAQVNIDLFSGTNVVCIAIVGHQIRPDAKWRIEAFSDSARTNRTYDSGSIYAWQSEDNANRTWSDSSFPTGRPKPDDVNDINWPLVHTILSGQNDLYWRITIDDQANADGYVEVGRVFIGYAWQSPINFSGGSSEQWNDDSDVEESFSGAEFFRNRTPFRRVDGTLKLLNVDPAFGRAQELMRRAKRTKEVMFVPRPDDPNHLNRRSFLARMEELPPLERIVPDLSSQPFRVKELR